MDTREAESNHGCDLGLGRQGISSGAIEGSAGPRGGKQRLPAAAFPGHESSPVENYSGKGPCFAAQKDTDSGNESEGGGNPVESCPESRLNQKEREGPSIIINLCNFVAESIK